MSAARLTTSMMASRVSLAGRPLKLDFEDVWGNVLHVAVVARITFQRRCRVTSSFTIAKVVYCKSIYCIFDMGCFNGVNPWKNTMGEILLKNPPWKSILFQIFC